MSKKALLEAITYDEARRYVDALIGDERLTSRDAQVISLVVNFARRAIRKPCKRAKVKQ